MMPPPPVPIEDWGRDHWSTLAYIETRCVDHSGKIDNRRMRCNPRVHRTLAHAASHGSPCPATRLAGGRTIDRHDDWSCLEDMAAEKLLTVEEFVKDSEAMFDCVEIVATLTKKGWDIAHQYRIHKGSGGSSSNFKPDIPPKE